MGSGRRRFAGFGQPLAHFVGVGITPGDADDGDFRAQRRQPCIDKPGAAQTLFLVMKPQDRNRTFRTDAARYARRRSNRA